MTKQTIFIAIAGGIISISAIVSLNIWVHIWLGISRG